MHDMQKVVDELRAAIAAIQNGDSRNAVLHCETATHEILYGSEEGDGEPNYLDDQSDDAEALASCGFGTDEDYDPFLDRCDYPEGLIGGDSDLLGEF